MKLGPYLLLNVLVVGGGIFLYDTLKGDPVVPSYTHTVTQAPEAARPSADSPGPVVLDAGDADFQAERNRQKLQELEALIRRMAVPVDSGGGSTGAAGGTVPALEMDAVEPGENAVFDEKTLTTLKAYMDEIRRRDEEQRRKDRVNEELNRLDLRLSDSQRDAVVSATLSYQDKARDVMRGTYTRDEAGQSERRTALETLREEYAVTIRSLVPNAEAEKITSSGRLGRAFGFFARGADGGAGFRGRGGDGGQGG